MPARRSSLKYLWSIPAVLKDRQIARADRTATRLSEPPRRRQGKHPAVQGAMRVPD